LLVICPKCKTKLKIPDEKIAPQGTRFKCPKCQTVLLVKKPVAAPAPKPAAPAPPRPQERFDGITAGAMDKTKAIVAHADIAVVERIKKVLDGMGLTVFPFTDGVETMVTAMRERPYLVIIDVALPKIYGFEVIKRLKGRPETQDMKAILISSIYDKKRYRREPASLYGADDYIDEHEIERELREKIKALGTVKTEGPEPGTEKAEEPVSPLERPPRAQPEEPISPPPPPAAREEPAFARNPAPAARPVAETAPVAPQPAAIPAPAPAAVGQEKDVLIEKARRLARTILADINLYAPEKVNYAVTNNNFEAVFATELREGKRLYDTRIPQETRDKGDFFHEAIQNFLESKKKSLGI
jgi:predicted Zn finger-like uncharacterized protein